MICFAAIMPHPPIIIPGIGKAGDLRLVQNTILAMNRMSEELEKAKPDTIVVISPHALLANNSFGINSAKKLSGDLLDFGLDEEMNFENDLEIAREIQKVSSSKNIVAYFFESALDHGAMVPLYYLSENTRSKLIHLSFSDLDFSSHYHYGEVIGNILEHSSRRVAVIASGDLSHRLIPGAPAGYSPKGKEFDQRLIELLKEKRTKDILNFDKALVRSAGECGLRSIAILLGIIRSKDWHFELLSYEGPFGVGYMVARLI
jgi:AmmeMemoRadiSam system protein B